MNASNICPASTINYSLWLARAACQLRRTTVMWFVFSSFHFRLRIRLFSSCHHENVTLRTHFQANILYQVTVSGHFCVLSERSSPQSTRSTLLKSPEHREQAWRTKSGHRFCPSSAKLIVASLVLGIRMVFLSNHRVSPLCQWFWSTLWH